MNILDETREIGFSPYKMFFLMGGCVLMLLGCLALALGYITSSGDFGRVVGWLGLIFFGAVMVLWLRHLRANGNAVITMTRQGLHDPRLSERPIPWREIENIYTWQSQGSKVLVIQVHPMTEEEIGLSRMARMTRGMNAGLGADGLCIASTGLRISHADLENAVADRVIAARAEAGW